MKYNISLHAVWLIAFSFSCHHPVQDEMIPVSRHLIADTVYSYPHTYQDVGIKKSDRMIMVSPYYQGFVILKNGHIIVVDPFNAGELHIYNIQTGQMEHLQTGHSNYFSVSNHDDTRYRDALLQLLPLSFYHFDMHSYYRYTLENDRVKLTRQNLRLQRVFITRAIQLTENKYVTLGFFRTGLLGLYDKESKRLNYYGHYPISVAIPFERKAMESMVQSFQGNIAYSDEHSQVVYASSNFAYLSCYHFTGSKLKFQWEKHIVPPPATKIVDGSLEIDNTVTQGGFSDVATAGDYIYASYTQINIPDTTHSILVYNMAGNHVATYHTDSPISDLMIDVENGTFYGISREVEWDPVIVRFRFDK